MEVSNTYAEEAAKNIQDSRAKHRFINVVTKMGRPTQYSHEICTDFLANRAMGKTIEQSLLDIGISDTTYYRWIKEKKEFRGIAKKGKMLAKSYWDDIAEDNLENRNFQFIPYIDQYKRRHRSGEDATVDCPGFSHENSDEENLNSIIRGISEQQVSPDQATKLMMLIKTKQEVTVQQEILLRIDQLEHDVKQQT